MPNLASLAQGIPLLEAAKDLPLDRLQKAINLGLLPIFLHADFESINKEELMKVCKISLPPEVKKTFELTLHTASKEITCNFILVEVEESSCIEEVRNKIQDKNSNHFCSLDPQWLEVFSAKYHTPDGKPVFSYESTNYDYFNILSGDPYKKWRYMREIPISFVRKGRWLVEVIDRNSESGII